MIQKDIDIISHIAQEKTQLANVNPIKFTMRSVVAGLYLVVAIILSYTIGALLFDKSLEISKILVAATFSLALGLIVFLGGELFTGNNFVMAIGFYDNKCRARDILKAWGLCYIGNAIGSVILAFLFVKSGASIELIQNYMSSIIYPKLELSINELFIRGILCNFMVCIAVLSTIKMNSESGKLTIMFWCVFVFVIAGFEHSIANMGIFSIGYLVLDGIPIYLILRNLLFVTLGNIVGGAILLAVPIKLMSVKEYELGNEDELRDENELKNKKKLSRA